MSSKFKVRDCVRLADDVSDIYMVGRVEESGRKVSWDNELMYKIFFGENNNYNGLYYEDELILDDGRIDFSEKIKDRLG